MLHGYCHAHVYKRDCMYKISICGVIAAESEFGEDGEIRHGAAGKDRGTETRAKLVGRVASFDKALGRGMVGGEQVIM
jgi:hypothetical protein